VSTGLIELAEGTEGKSVTEGSKSAFEDQRPVLHILLNPRFTLVPTTDESDRPVVPRAIIGRFHQDAFTAKHVLVTNVRQYAETGRSPRNQY